MENPDYRQQAPIMGVSDWLITLLIMIIPLVNIIMLFVWAFGDNTNVNKSNWAKASLLMILIYIAIFIGITVIFGIGLFTALSELD